MTTSELRGDPLDPLHHCELERFHEMSEVAPEIAVIYAESYCARWRVRLPDWAGEFAPSMALEKIRPRTRQPVGRARSGLARYRQDMVHYTRADVVEDLRRGQLEVKEHVKLLRATPGGERNLKSLVKMHHWLGTSWLRAYECASMYFKDTPAQGSPDTMKASYVFVKGLMQSRTLAMRFCFDEYAIRHTLGDEVLIELFRYRKCTPIYDLTH